MDVRRGNVVLIVLPGELGKPRPGVVVQSDGIDQQRTTIVCPLSSDVTDAPTLRPIIEPSRSNGLRARSQIMVEKLAAVRQTRIRKVVGTLDRDDQAALDGALLIILGLTA